MTAELSWYRAGRIFTWIAAAGLALGSLSYLLLAFGVTAPAEPSFTGLPGTVAEAGRRGLAALEYRRAVMVQDAVSMMLLAVGMLALIPVGVALRALSGRGTRQDLVATAFLVGGLLGTSGTLFILGVHLFAARLEIPALVGQPELVVGFQLASSLAIRGADLLVCLFFLPTGLAAYWSAGLALDGVALSRGLSRLSRVLAVGCWLALLVGLTSDLTGAPGAVVAFQLIMLVIGVFLAPIWSIWLGREFRWREAPAPQVA